MPVAITAWEARHRRPHLNPTQAAYPRLPQCTKCASPNPAVSTRQLLLHSPVTLPAGEPKPVAQKKLAEQLFVRGRNGVWGEVELAGPQLSLEKGKSIADHIRPSTLGRPLSRHPPASSREEPASRLGSVTREGRRRRAARGAEAFMQPVDGNTHVTGCALRRVRHQTSGSATWRSASSTNQQGKLDALCGRRRPVCGRLASPPLLCSETGPSSRLVRCSFVMEMGPGHQSVAEEWYLGCRSCYSCGFVAGQRSP